MIYDRDSLLILIKTILYSFRKHDEAILRIIFSTKKLDVLKSFPSLPLFKGSK